MKKAYLKIGAFVLTFALLCGFLVSPQKVYASAKENKHVIYALGDDLTVTSYIKSTGAYCDITNSDSNASVSTSYTTFRLWVHFNEVIPAGSLVDVRAIINNGPGNISSVVGWFGQQRGSGYETETNVSEDISFTYSGNGRFSRSDSRFYTTDDVSSICFDITYSSRTSSTIYLNVIKLKIEYLAPDPIESELTELNTTSNSLLDNIKNLLTGQTTLQSFLENSIFVYLKGVFQYIRDLPDNLSGFFTDLGDKITALPDNLSSFFTDLGDKITDLGDFFSMSGGGGHSFDSSPLEQATNDLEELRLSLQEDDAKKVFDDLDEYLPDDNHLLLRVYSLVFENHLMLNAIYLSMIFGVIGYVVFGKR